MKNIMDELLEGYLNGNISWARTRFETAPYTFGELFEYYVATYNPTKSDMVLFVKRFSHD